MTAPGWYPDPAGGGGKRYWDGNAWRHPIPAAPAKKTRTWPVVVVATLAVMGGCAVYAANDRNGGGSRTDCGDVGPTCDGTPKADGLYKVSGSGLFDTGISPGWIATNGPRPGERSCIWVRLSGPQNRLEWVIDGGTVKPGDEPQYVHIEASDNSFFSNGCEPWVRIDRK